MTSSSPTFEEVKEVVSKRSPSFGDSILAVFPWGSRIYQCSTPQSDYDFIVVIEDGILPALDLLEIKPNGTNAIDKRFIVLEEGLINTTLISYHDWRICLLQHHHECLEVLYTPRQLFLFISPKITHLLDSFVLDKDMLRRTAAWESKRRYTRAVYPARETMRRGKKDLVHALRYLLFALQMFDHDRITDFTCANEYYRQIVMETDEVQTEAQFKTLMQKWEPERYKLSHQLGQARVSRRFYGRVDTERRFLAITRSKHAFDLQKGDSIKILSNPHLQTIVSPNAMDHPLQILDEALSGSESGLIGLEDRFPIVWCRDSKLPEILILYPQRVVPDPSVPLIQAIYNGAIIQMLEDGSYRVLSIGLPSINSSIGLPPSLRDVWDQRLSSKNSGDRLLVEEMVDGTQVSMYWLNGEWRIGSRVEPLSPSMTLSFVPINDVDTEVRLNDEFWRIWKGRGYQLPSDENSKNLCFTLIMNSDLHRHVVRYEIPDIFCVHVRNRETGSVVDHRQIAAQFQWKVPNSLPLPLPSSLNDLEKISFDLNPLLIKGYILKYVSSDSWDAITVKNSIYTSIRYGTDFSTIGQMNMRAEVDRKLLLQQAVFNTGPRFLEVFPHWKAQFDQTTEVYTQFCNMIDAEYRIHWRKERKEFVSAVSDFSQCQALLRMYQNRYPSASEYFSTLPLKQQYMYKPWREFLKSNHEALFRFYQGEDEDGGVD
jgi:hypothetical protein